MENIVIINFQRRGDIVQTFPLIYALKKKFFTSALKSTQTF